MPKKTARKQTGLRLTTGVRAGEVNCEALNQAWSQTLLDGGLGFNEACFSAVVNGC